MAKKVLKDNLTKVAGGSNEQLHIDHDEFGTYFVTSSNKDLNAKFQSYIDSTANPYSVELDKKIFFTTEQDARDALSGFENWEG